MFLCYILPPASRIGPVSEAERAQYQPRANLPQKAVQELIDEGLPVLQPYLSASVKIKESHEHAVPMVHLDPRHKLTLEFIALYENLEPKKKKSK